MEDRVLRSESVSSLTSLDIAESCFERGIPISSESLTSWLETTPDLKDEDKVLFALDTYVAHNSHLKS